MEKITDYALCTGCHACYNICPKKCIVMQSDKHGFKYPIINNDICINCGLCKSVCPIENKYIGNKRGAAFACINKNDVIRLDSSSGGIFSLLANEILDRGGVVVGAAFTDKFSVEHVIVDSKYGLEKLRGSKYIQSNIGDIYKIVKNYLENDKYVLFSGTPCQISGIKCYLGKSYDKIIYQDFICHGVPSPLVWRKYIESVEREYNKIIPKTIPISFRNKCNGWENFSLKIVFSDKTELIEQFNNNLYMKAFLGNLCLRPSCYNCHSKSLERESDITLADFWGIDKISSKMNDNKGTSLVLVNSDKGKELFFKIKNLMHIEEINDEKFDLAIKNNISAYKSVEKPNTYDIFMKMINEKSFKKAYCAATNKKLLSRIKNRFGKFLKI